MPVYLINSNISYISVNNIYRHIETAMSAVRMPHVRTSTHRGLLSAIWVLIAQWLERLTGDQKVAGSIPVWGSETFFWVCDKAWVANSFPLIHQAASHLHTYIFTTVMFISGKQIDLDGRNYVLKLLVHQSVSSGMKVTAWILNREQ